MRCGNLSLVNLITLNKYLNLSVFICSELFAIQKQKELIVTDGEGRHYFMKTIALKALLSADFLLLARR